MVGVLVVLTMAHAAEAQMHDAEMRRQVVNTDSREATIHWTTQRLQANERQEPSSSGVETKKMIGERSAMKMAASEGRRWRGLELLNPVQFSGCGYASYDVD